MTGHERLSARCLLHDTLYPVETGHSADFTAFQQQCLALLPGKYACDDVSLASIIFRNQVTKHIGRIATYWLRLYCTLDEFLDM